MWADVYLHFNNFNQISQCFTQIQAAHQPSMTEKLCMCALVDLNGNVSQQKWMHSNAAWKKEKGAEEPCRVKQDRKRGRMKEGGRERSCSISSTGERFKA